MSRGLELNPKVEAISLPDSRTMTNLTTARVTGWGGVFSQDPESLTNTNQRLSCYLQEVELNVEIPGSVETRSHQLHPH